jgi:tetrahydromethanopterin S-methyltransferase subunit F
MSDQQGKRNRIHRILAASEHIQDKRQEVIRDQRILVGTENTTEGEKWTATLERG